ncbi:MAG TPA: NAD-dependent epimerase/dehydratase family protein, partial [Gemmatimonadales bacterium]
HYEKILVERALLGGNLPATVLRLPAVYGPGDPHRRFRPFIKRMLDQRPAILLEVHQAGWRWTHGYVEDVAFAIALSVINEQAVGKVYNLGEAATPSVRDRVRRIAELVSWSGSLASLKRDLLPAHLQMPYEPQQDLVMETSLIRGDLDFQESVTEADGLRRTVEWELANAPASGDPTPEEYAAEDAVRS